MRKIESLVKHTVLEKQQHVLIRYKRQVTAPLFYGKRFICPICIGHFRKFLTFGVKPRLNAQCPRCGSLERHRLLWLYLRDRTDFFVANLKVLEIAPLDVLQRKFEAMKNLDYISVDLESPISMLRMDVTNLIFTDNSFDCVLCYHVLEHVQDDLKAMKEIFRVLKPNGWAILQVPILGQKTFDGTDITSAEERQRLFGQSDHVRAYGLDYKDRLEAAGFTVTVDDYFRRLALDEVRRFGLIGTEDIYFCKKI